MTKPPSPFAVPEPWNAVADGYADESPLAMGPFSVRAAELARLTPESRVVDVACGPGTTTLHIAPHVAKVTAVDFSESMLRRLVGRLDDLNLGNVEVVQGDGQALPLASDAFDAAFSMFGLMFFPDRSKGYDELFRVLAPGGIAIVSSWAPVSDSPLMQLLFGALCAADPGRPEPRYDPESLENPTVLATELATAGFDEVTVVRHTVSFAFDDAADLWDRMVRSSAPLVMLRNKLGEEAWTDQAKKALAYIEGAIRGGTRETSTTAFLGIGRKPAD